MNRSRKTKAFKPTDFMPLRERDDARVERQEVAAKARGFFDNYRTRRAAKQKEA